jgi:hypothetical protein
MKNPPHRSITQPKYPGKALLSFLFHCLISKRLDASLDAFDNDPTIVLDVSELSGERSSDSKSGKLNGKVKNSDATLSELRQQHRR